MSARVHNKPHVNSAGLSIAEGPLLSLLCVTLQKGKITLPLPPTTMDVVVYTGSRGRKGGGKWGDVWKPTSWMYAKVDQNPHVKTSRL